MGLLIVVSCSSSSGGTQAGGAAGAGGWDAAHPAACGVPAYQWLAREQVGQVLESAPGLTMKGSEVQSLLASFSQLKVHHAFANGGQLHQVRYQTQDRGKTIDATMMVGIPDVPSAATMPVMLYLHGTTGFDDSCAPSNDANNVLKQMAAVAMLFTANGYITVMPDYIGMKSLGDPSPNLHPYLVAEPTAIASLDGLRAATAFLATKAPNLTMGATFVSGLSEGGFAAESTVLFAPFYAPEIAFKGAAYISAPTDLGGSMRVAYQTKNDSIVPLGIGTLLGPSQWYGAPALSTMFVAPWDTTVVDSVKNACGKGYVNPLKGITDPTAVFQPAYIDALSGQAYPAPFDCYVSTNSPISSPLPLNTKVPALFIVGEKDTLVDPTTNRAAFTTLCGRGANMAYLECAGADHSGAEYQSHDDMLTFFDDRAAGVPMPAGACAVTPAKTCASAP
jgi:pimeloyl-ACP methyl ester carboxylesterase